ncbi:MAG TPA: hypothetical protein ENI87_01785 [bacterium]|nr:hypothetical protein [bacterium]
MFYSGGFLAGYRTYLVAALIALQAFVRWAVNAEISFVEFLDVLFSSDVLTGLGLGFLRAGLKRGTGA